MPRPWDRTGQDDDSNVRQLDPLGPQTAPFTIRRGWRRIGLRRDGGVRRIGQPRSGPGERRSG
jgi:hypothetical protein